MADPLKRTLIIADEQDITEKGIAESFRKKLFPPYKNF